MRVTFRINFGTCPQVLKVVLAGFLKLSPISHNKALQKHWNKPGKPGSVGSVTIGTGRLTRNAQHSHLDAFRSSYSGATDHRAGRSICRRLPSRHVCRCAPLHFLFFLLHSHFTHYFHRLSLYQHSHFHIYTFCFYIPYWCYPASYPATSINGYSLKMETRRSSLSLYWLRLLLRHFEIQ